MEREAEEARREELAELDRQLASGALTRPLYELKKKALGK